MRTLRCSELGSFLYCERAWWYQQQGAQPGNLSEMAEGTRLHAIHGRRVLRSRMMNLLGWLLLLTSLIAIIYGLVSLVL
jgi:hypothetical protein